MENALVKNYLQLSIENFGPINKIETELLDSNFTVLIGPNMGGKSSILQAMFIPQLLNQDFIKELKKSIKEHSSFSSKLIYSFKLSNRFIKQEIVKNNSSNNINYEIRLNYEIVISDLSFE